MIDRYQLKKILWDLKATKSRKAISISKEKCRNLSTLSKKFREGDFGYFCEDGML